MKSVNALRDKCVTADMEAGESKAIVSVATIDISTVGAE